MTDFVPAVMQSLWKFAHVCSIRLFSFHDEKFVEFQWNGSFLFVGYDFFRTDP